MVPRTGGGRRCRRSVAALLFTVIVSPALLATVVVAALLATSCGEPSPTDGRSLGPSPAGIVARVDGTPITSADVERATGIAALLAEEVEREEVLADLIGGVLIAREAARLGVEVDRAQVETRLAELAEAFGGREELAAELAAAGLAEDDLRVAVEAVVLAEAVQEAKYPQATATEDDARAFYDENEELFTTPAEVRLGDIAVRTEAIADSVVERLDEGQSFSSAARQFSVDPELRANEGMRGWVSIASLPDQAREAVSRAPIGGLSDPVQIGPLWHVFKVIGRRSEETRPFTEVADVIREELTRRRQALELAAWVEAERERVDVVVVGGVVSPSP